MTGGSLATGWDTVADRAARVAVAPAGGLSSAEAAGRLARYGPNELPRAGRTPLWRLVAGQLRDPLILVLPGCCGCRVSRYRFMLAQITCSWPPPIQLITGASRLAASFGRTLHDQRIRVALGTGSKVSVPSMSACRVVVRQARRA